MAAIITPLFQITRHATSCYNINEYPSRLGRLTADGMPSLAKYGITETIKLAKKEMNTPRFQASIVCVSNLIRTWMTAVLLYTFFDNTTNLPRTTITLRICPHLREVGGKGNGVYPLTHSIPKFIDFLNLIKKDKNYSELKEIVLLIPKRREMPHTDWVKIIITIPKNKLAPTIIYDEVQFCNKTKITDEINSYSTDGDIHEFMIWFSKSFLEERGLVHVVAHSGIMKHYFDKKFKKNGKREKFDIRKHTVKELPTIGIDYQNCWTFTTSLTMPPQQLIDSIQYGYANPDKVGIDPNEPSSEGEGSLCRKNVEEIKCSMKGGYQTKKNRIKSHRIKSHRIKSHRIKSNNKI